MPDLRIPLTHPRVSAPAATRHGGRPMPCHTPTTTLRGTITP